MTKIEAPYFGIIDHAKRIAMFDDREAAISDALERAESLGKAVELCARRLIMDCCEDSDFPKRARFHELGISDREGIRITRAAVAEYLYEQYCPKNRRAVNLHFFQDCYPCV